jgi:hypothetical protein
MTENTGNYDPDAVLERETLMTFRRHAIRMLKVLDAGDSYSQDDVWGLVHAVLLLTEPKNVGRLTDSR